MSLGIRLNGWKSASSTLLSPTWLFHFIQCKNCFHASLWLCTPVIRDQLWGYARKHSCMLSVRDVLQTSVWVWLCHMPSLEDELILAVSSACQTSAAAGRRSHRAHSRLAMMRPQSMAVCPNERGRINRISEFFSANERGDKRYVERDKLLRQTGTWVFNEIEYKRHYIIMKQRGCSQ